MTFITVEPRAARPASPARPPGREAGRLDSSLLPQLARWARSHALRDGLFLALLATCVLLFGNFAAVRAVMQPRAQLMGVSTAAEIGAIHDAYLRVPPPQRLAWVEQLVAASRGGLILGPQGPDALITPRISIQAETMRVLQQQVPDIPVGFSEGGGNPQVWFALPDEGGDLLWLRIPVVNAAELTGILFAAWGSGGVLVVLSGLAVMGWRQQRRLRGAGNALAQVEAGVPQGPMARLVSTPAPPADLPEVQSLEELVRVMSGRMQRLESQRDQALLSAAREFRAVLRDAAADPLQAHRLGAFDRIAGQWVDFATRGRWVAQPVQPVDLNALVERTTRRAPVGVTLGLAPIPPLALRPAAIECLLDNLLRNALTHGGGQVVLTSAEEGDWVVLRVMDRGEPLADDELAMMGRPFYRTEAARADGVSAGLGLALAHDIAQLHGGDLRVLRREGGGLAVEVRLPRPQDEESAALARPVVRRPRPAWVGLLGDMAWLAVLYLGALALGLSLLTRTVLEPNLQASSRIWVNVLRGMTAAYVTLPAEARPAYLLDLQRHSGGLIQVSDPAQFTVSPPLFRGARVTLDEIQRGLPDLALAASPLPDSALWVRMPADAGQSPGPWLRLRTRMYSTDQAFIILGVGLLVAASAAYLALRARRRLDWAAQALREGGADLQSQARAHGENRAMVEGLMSVRQRFVSACERLAQARDEQGQLLARVVQDLRASTGALRREGGPSLGLAACADGLQRAIEGLAWLAQCAGQPGQTRVQVNELLAAWPIEPAVAARHPVRWLLGAVPPVALGEDEARRILGGILGYLLAQPQDRLEVSSTHESGWVVVRFTERGGRTDPGAATQALVQTCHLAEAHGGFMRFGRAPDRGGAQVEVLLPAALS